MICIEMVPGLARFLSVITIALACELFSLWHLLALGELFS